MKRWSDEARRRAMHLGAPAAWAMRHEWRTVEVLKQLDSTGDLAADLDRVIAEAVAWASDPRMVQSSRPMTQPVKRSR
jgi:hypothetical protein